MRFTSTLKKKYTPFMLLGALIMLTSCGSYQYVGYDNDGIYSSDEVVVEVEQAATNRTNSNYYANYFADQVTDAQLAQEETDEVFTDIDSYTSGNVANNEVEIIEDYGGWGQVNDRVVINYYDNGWNNWGWGWDPWLWNGGFGWGWNNWGWGWNRWNRWGGLGFGWGWGWNDPWLWNGGFGWGWNNYWGWNNGFYRNNLAFNRSRRGAYNRDLALNSRNNLSRRIGNSSLSRRSSGLTRNRDGSRTRVGRNISGRPSRGTVSRPRGTTTRPSRGTISRPRGTTTRPSRGSTTRPSRGNTARPSRGNISRPSRGTTTRSSRGSSRSSGSVRSSGGSRSSSGSSRGGGSRGGGRRG
ncbi:hypothetical protein DFQ05_1895 [Winogradskyella wandonensis]|uniref:Vitellogenin II n=1 Tax=Winogradskyella wandonensis TaxID=1442586 RepID=A0A4R1KNI5_9FLAO|nr:hypothetical protein [Winogradskyella wandonensis]TCK66625.1 hypothetical protein DFQ05_1895 [Winogradskyella wandonensis]